MIIFTNYVFMFPNHPGLEQIKQFLWPFRMSLKLVVFLPSAVKERKRKGETRH